ncbi:MAG: hypothetical protein LBQ67_04445 [Treponema sp.]|nr:hypothetical protein [Treponema sp.]
MAYRPKADIGNIKTEQYQYDLKKHGPQGVGDDGIKNKGRNHSGDNRPRNGKEAKEKHQKQFLAYVFSGQKGQDLFCRQCPRREGTEYRQGKAIDG